MGKNLMQKEVQKLVLYSWGKSMITPKNLYPLALRFLPVSSAQMEEYLPLTKYVGVGYLQGVEWVGLGSLYLANGGPWTARHRIKYAPDESQVVLSLKTKLRSAFIPKKILR
jgi:hypothetical protein